MLELLIGKTDQVGSAELFKKEESLEVVELKSHKRMEA